MQDETAGLPIIDVLDQHRFNAAKLQAYLLARVEDFGADLKVHQFVGGASNPTFLLTTKSNGGVKRYVLRKKPPGKLLPSAHQVDREYRFMQALSTTDIPVPVMRLLCQDEAIIGTDFYLMDFLDGHVFDNPILPSQTANNRHAIFHGQISTLARLHRVDFEAAGLGDYLRPGHFLQRQLNRFEKQYRAAKTIRVPSMDALIEALKQRLPSAEPGTIFHGDYRLGNLMYHRDRPELVAILDWELATIGNPLVDLSYCLLPWYVEASPFGYVGKLDPAEGYTSGASLVREYCRLVGRSGIENWNVYLAFSLFRIASIAQGVLQRIHAGTVSSARADSVKIGGNDVNPVDQLSTAAFALLSDDALSVIEV